MIRIKTDYSINLQIYLYRKIVYKCTHTQQIFEINFLENEALCGKILFYIFDLFFRVESISGQEFL